MTDFQLSEDQQTALSKVLAWWENESRFEEPFILTGSAGTGKSTITREILKELPIESKYICMLAPTGTAVKNIQQKNPEIKAQTISSFIERPFTYIRVVDPKTGDTVNTLTNTDDLIASDYIVTDDENLKFEPDNFGFIRILSTAVAKHGLYIETAVGFKLKDPDTDDKETVLPRLLIIDELGMVSEDKLEHIRNMGIPILGMGDPYQLKPVASVQNKLIKATERTAFYHELTVIHRQEGDNPIVTVATSARTGGDWLATARGISSNNIVVAPSLRNNEQRLSGLLSRADMVLSPSNKNVQFFNKLAHKFIHGDETLSCGEKILFTSNTSSKSNGSPILTNGMQGTVNELIDTPDDVVDLGLQLIKVTSFNKEFVLLVNTIHLDDTRTKYSELAKTKSSKLQNIILERSGRFSVEGAILDMGTSIDEIVYISYGYAMTVHKSQGKEWDNVIFDTEIPQRMLSSSQPLVYTAITRAKENIVFI